MPDIHIGLAADSNVGKYLYFTLGSALLNANHDDVLHFHILSEDIPQADKDRLYRLVSAHPGATLEFVEFDFERCALGKNSNKKYSAAVFGALYIPSLFDNLERVIYLDYDVVVMSSLSELWNTDLDNYVLAAVIDKMGVLNSKYPASIEIKCEHYLNSGVLLLDCHQWRENNLLEVIIEQFKNQQFKYPDQDILNVFFNGKFKVLDKSWNAHTGLPRCATDHIIHYTAKKPTTSLFIRDPEYFWQVAMKLPESKALLSAVRDEVANLTPARQNRCLTKYRLLSHLFFCRRHYLKKIGIHEQAYQLLDQVRPYLLQ